MLDRGEDNALLRFALGSEYLKQREYAIAVDHLRAAIEHQPTYSAALKLLGKALTGAGDVVDAIDAYDQGIEVAEKQGDKQAVREMRVLVRRLRKQISEET